MSKYKSRRRERLAESQNWRCCWCGIECHNNSDGKRETFATIEHVIPKNRGGKGVWENVVMSCSECNTARGDDINRSIKQILNEVVDPLRFKNRVERDQNRYLRNLNRYIRRAREIHENGWNTIIQSNGKPLQPERWLSSMKLKGRHKKQVQRIMSEENA